MPNRVLQPYLRYHLNFIVHNTIAQGIGVGYTRRCGIPQGRPLSMTFVALLMRAWLVQMRSMQVDAKVLADGAMIVAKGRRMLRQYTKALDYTHEYLQDMGARVAPGKSYHFASTDLGRK